MAQQFSFDAADLASAVSRTFSSRNTEVADFDALKAELAGADHLERQWRAFLQKAKLQAPERFADVLSYIGDFLIPIFRVINEGGEAATRWKAPGPWK